MSESNKDVIKLDAQIAEQKREAWGRIGVGVYKGEINLQLQSQEIISSLIIPTKTEEIAATEDGLKIIKKKLEQLELNRAELTSRFDAVKKRLMEPEKNVSLHINTVSAALIKVKQQAEADRKKDEQKEKELKQVAEKVRIYIADVKAGYYKSQAELLSNAYAHALDNVKPEDLPQYLVKLKKRITEANRKIATPKILATHNDQATIDQEISKIFDSECPSALSFVEGFDADIDHKFSDYDLAYKNKEQAKILNKQVTEEIQQAVELNKQQEVTSANVQAISTGLSVIDATKPLKQIYKISNEETLENANQIITAYLANANLCAPKLRIKNYFNLSVKQMIAALEDLKNEDEKFSFTGLSWTTENKL